MQCTGTVQMSSTGMLHHIHVLLDLHVCEFVILVGGVLPRNAAAAAAQKVVEDLHQPGYAAAALMAKPKPKARVRGQAPARAQTPAEAAAAAAAAATVGLWDPVPAPVRAPKKPQGEQLVPTAFHLFFTTLDYECVLIHAIHSICSCTSGCATCQPHLPPSHERCISCTRSCLHVANI